MKRFTTAALTAAALTFAAPAAMASTFSFDDVEVMQAMNGSQVFTSDGKLVGTLTDVDLDADKGNFIVDVANSSNINSSRVTIVAEEGQVLFSDDVLTLQITETELDVGLNGDNRTDNIARIVLVD